jgi:glycosyltransferase involved in cell wall biosynthesis
MKVLHVISSIDMQAGGTTAALVALASPQAQAGLDVTVASTFGDSNGTTAAEMLRSSGVKVELIGPAKGKLQRHPELSAKMQSLVREADVVHIHALWEEIMHVAAREAHRQGKGYVVTPHGMLDPWSLRQSKWVKRLYLAWRLRANLNRADAIHFTSEIERDLVRRLGLKPASVVVPNGLQLEEFEKLPAKGTFRSRYPEIGERRIVLFMSRLHPKKGLELLVPAFANAGVEDAVLVIAGPGAAEYREQIERRVGEENLAGRVVFTGMLHGAERIAALVDADLFVLPSYQENFGIVVIEALAAGCPVVISDQVNIHREISAAGVGGVVPLEVDALAREIKRWMTDKTLRQAAGEKGRRWVREHFDQHAIARTWVSEYQRILAGH